MHLTKCWTYFTFTVLSPSQNYTQRRTPGTNSIKETSVGWKGGLFWGYENLICFSHSRDGSPSATPVTTPLPASAFQFARLAPLLYLWHVPEMRKEQLPTNPLHSPTSKTSVLSPTPHLLWSNHSPSLSNLIKLINSFPPSPISFHLI